MTRMPPDVYARRRWRRVQYLADQFWIRWRREYLQGMHTRTKWEKPKRNLRTEDVVLVKEEGAYRNGWPIGRVSEAIASDEGQVRKVQVKIEGLEAGGGGGPDPAFPLLLHENPASRTDFHRYPESRFLSQKSTL